MNPLQLLEWVAAGAGVVVIVTVTAAIVAGVIGSLRGEDKS